LRPNAAGGSGHDTRGGGFVEDLQELVIRESAHPCERVELELSTEDRREGQNATASVGQERQTSTDHLPYPRRDRASRQGCSVRVLEVPFCGQEPDHLAHVERVPLGLLLHGLDRGRRNLSVYGGFDQPRNFGALKPCQRDLPGRHMTRHLRHR
jgi:hypothetical protein